jgi:hypothetical protein
VTTLGLPIALAGDGQQVPCVDGTQRPYLSFDAATSTGALAGVLEALEAFVPWYSGVHCGAGYKSQASALAYEGARLAALAFAGRGPGSGDVAVIRQNTTDAISYLAGRLGLSRSGGMLPPRPVDRGLLSRRDRQPLPVAIPAECRILRDLGPWMPACPGGDAEAGSAGLASRSGVTREFARYGTQSLP